DCDGYTDGNDILDCPPGNIEVYRDLSQCVKPGDEFNVTLTINVDESDKPNSYILYETIPDGVDMIDSNDVYYSPATRTLKIMVFDSPYYNTKVEDWTLTYRLRYRTESTNLFHGYVRYNRNDYSILGDYNLTCNTEDDPPVVLIQSPKNITYYTGPVPLIATVNETVKQMHFSIDNNPPSLICTNCNYFTQNLSLTVGHHELIVYAADYSANTGNATVAFTIDYCTPDWIQNNTWSKCINNIRYKNYYDTNDCNNSEERPENIYQTCVSPKSPVEAYRTLPDNVSFGMQFNVTLNIDVNESAKPNIYILYETIPIGFNVVNTGGMQYTVSTRTLKLMVYESPYFNTHVEDKIVTYTLIPYNYSQGTFNGTLRYNYKSQDILGDIQVPVS
ncbi:MAG: hypothetical protein KAJ19_29830, partial [Gammaproteobacteria bacterium]|nr:hypothetical protein [Gammaproteobacteria bacterium]